MTRRFLGVAAVVVLAGALAATAQGPDLAGTWDIDAQYDVPVDQAEVVVRCLYEGTADLNEQMGFWTGVVELMLVGSEPAGEANEAFCEQKLSGTLVNGSVQDSRFNGLLENGGLGTGEISGTIDGLSPSGAPAPAQPLSISGQLTPTSGQFVGNNSAVWAASQRQPAPTLPAPALGLLLFLLVAGGGLLILRRRTV